MTKSRLGIAMSGGVDSTAVTLMLKERYQVHGFFMDLAQPDFREQKERVLQLAEAIGISLTVIDLKHQFKTQVLDYFSNYYLDGKTPNPCIICNRHIKFGLFLDAIIEAGMDRVATGHYATISRSGDRYFLHKGSDIKKDQSYFLSRLTQDQLSKIIFPLGSQAKETIYRYVEEQGFTDFRGKESQDICFLKNRTVGSLIESGRSNIAGPGPVLSVDGTVLGSHNGLHKYTIGQRRGLGLPDLTPWYVCSMDLANNTLVVGKENDLWSHCLVGCSAHWLDEQAPPEGRYQVKIRSTHRGTAAMLTHLDDHTFRLVFDEPQRAVAPGQYAVLYDGDRLIGSGEITPDSPADKPVIN